MGELICLCTLRNYGDSYHHPKRFHQDTIAEQRQMTQLRDVIANRMFENRQLLEIILNVSLVVLHYYSCAFVVPA